MLEPTQVKSEPADNGGYGVSPALSATSPIATVTSPSTGGVRIASSVVKSGVVQATPTTMQSIIIGASLGNIGSVVSGGQPSYSLKGTSLLKPVAGNSGQGTTQSVLLIPSSGANVPKVLRDLSGRKSCVQNSLLCFHFLLVQCTTEVTLKNRPKNLCRYMYCLECNYFPFL